METSLTDRAARIEAAVMDIALQPDRTAAAHKLIAHARGLAKADAVAFEGDGLFDGVQAGDSGDDEVIARMEFVLRVPEGVSGAGDSLGTLSFTVADGATAESFAGRAGAALWIVAERELTNSQLRTEQSLVEAGKSLGQELTLEGVLRRIVELACNLVDARYGALGVLDESGDQLARFITVGIDDPTRRAIGDLPTGRGILGVLIREPKPLRLADIGADPRSVGFPPHHPPMRSFLGVPIIARGGVKGRIYLAEKRDGSEFSLDNERVAVTLASQAAIAIETAELYESATRTARDLAQANDELEQAGRHKSAFLANMSHELRTPLNSIIGYTTLLLEEREGFTADQVADLEVIGSSGTHLLSLITDLLDLSKIEAGKVELRTSEVDIAQVLQDAVASLRPQVEQSGVELSVVGASTLVIECDRSRLRQMLLNVLGNAVKFTTTGSIIASVGPSESGGVHIEIRDTGPGIPERDLHRIFESFFQSEAALARTPRSAEGAGLGLAITRMLAELHGGEVRIESVLGEGTTVTIDLPASPLPPTSPYLGGAHGY